MCSMEYRFDLYRYIVPAADLLSPPQLLLDGVEIPTIALSPRLSRLLTFLLQNRARPVANVEAIKYVWGERGQHRMKVSAQATKALRNYEAAWTNLVERPAARFCGHGPALSLR